MYTTDLNRLYVYLITYITSSVIDFYNLQFKPIYGSSSLMPAYYTMFLTGFFPTFLISFGTFLRTVVALRGPVV